MKPIYTFNFRVGATYCCGGGNQGCYSLSESHTTRRCHRQCPNFHYYATEVHQ